MFAQTPQAQTPSNKRVQENKKLYAKIVLTNPKLFDGSVLKTVSSKRLWYLCYITMRLFCFAKGVLPQMLSAYEKKNTCLHWCTPVEGKLFFCVTIVKLSVHLFYLDFLKIILNVVRQ